MLKKQGIPDDMIRVLTTIITERQEELDLTNEETLLASLGKAMEKLFYETVLFGRQHPYQGTAKHGGGVPKRQGTGVSYLPESWRIGTKPHGGKLCDSSGPVVESRYRAVGNRPRLSYRAEPKSNSLSPYRRAYYRGEDSSPAPNQAVAGGLAARRNEYVAQTHHARPLGTAGVG